MLPRRCALCLFGLRRRFAPLALALVCLWSSGGQGREPARLKPGWTQLFNGKDLTGWDTYLGPAYDPSKEDFAGPRVGLNRDPNGVFKVHAVDGRPAIHISGQYFGGLSTKQEFENYQLSLQFKWGEDRFAPRAKSKRDSGLLYHASGPHGAEWYFWMQSQEMQIQEGDCGDYWGLGSVLVEVSAVVGKQMGPNKRPLHSYAPGAPALMFHRDLPRGGHVQKARRKLAEKPRGQWNTVELYTVKGTSVHVVNGVVQMVLRNSSQIVDNRIVPLTRGKIQLQSEGAEVFYRDIRILPISQIPSRLLR